MARSDQRWTLPEIAKISNGVYRTMHTWVESGLLQPVEPSKGTGHPALFDEIGLRRACVLVKLSRAGLSLDGLRRAVEHPSTLRGEIDVLLRQLVRLDSQEGS